MYRYKPAKLDQSILARLGIPIRRIRTTRVLTTKFSTTRVLNLVLLIRASGYCTPSTTVWEQIVYQ